MSVYEIRVQGRLDQHWATWFEKLTLTYDGDCTILRGPLVDEAALHGILAKVRDLNVRLLSVQAIGEDNSAVGAQTTAESVASTPEEPREDAHNDNARRKSRRTRSRKAPRKDSL